MVTPVPSVRTGAQIYMDNAAEGRFGSYEDGFTMLEMSRKHYREVGLGCGWTDEAAGRRRAGGGKADAARHPDSAIPKTLSGRADPV